MKSKLLHAVLSLTFPLILCFPPNSLATDFSGPVVRVLDGDTIEVLHNQHPERIRLSGIDCPEKGQAYGQRAKQAASVLVFGKKVTLQTHGHDKYGRTLADVLLPDGTNVNYELVKDGWCWWYRKYAPLDTELEGLEKAARDAKKGLWVDPAPIPPRVYRKARRGQSLDLSDLVPKRVTLRGMLLPMAHHGLVLSSRILPLALPRRITPSLIIVAVTSITDLTVRITARLQHITEWSLMARLSLLPA